MKKKFLTGIAVLAIAAVAAFNVGFNSPEEKLSDIALANIEDLDDDIEGGLSLPDRKSVETTLTIVEGNISWSVRITCCVDGKTSCSADSRCHSVLI